MIGLAETRIQQLLSDGRPRTAWDISQKLKMKPEQVALSVHRLGLASAITADRSIDIEIPIYERT